MKFDDIEIDQDLQVKMFNGDRYVWRRCTVTNKNVTKQNRRVTVSILDGPGLVVKPGRLRAVK